MHLRPVERFKRIAQLAAREIAIVHMSRPPNFWNREARPISAIAYLRQVTQQYRIRMERSPHNFKEQAYAYCLPRGTGRFPNAISTPPAIEIRSFAPGDDATAFLTLNEEWITRYFTLEAKDLETLNEPVHAILLKGGHIFMAYAGSEAVGCVALIHMQDGVYELSKMAVARHMRGRGIGRRLLQHAIAQARVFDAKSLFLGSNTRLKNAVHLYESVGFRHVEPGRLPPVPYSRADVFTELSLG